jgi:hypothetical protein
MAFMARAIDVLHWLCILQLHNRIRIVKKLSLHHVGIVSNRTNIAVR